MNLLKVLAGHSHLLIRPFKLGAALGLAAVIVISRALSMVLLHELHQILQTSTAIVPQF